MKKLTIVFLISIIMLSGSTNQVQGEVDFTAKLDGEVYELGEIPILTITKINAGTLDVYLFKEGETPDVYYSIHFVANADGSPITEVYRLNADEISGIGDYIIEIYNQDGEGKETTFEVVREVEQDAETSLFFSMVLSALILTPILIRKTKK